MWVSTLPDHGCSYKVSPVLWTRKHLQDWFYLPAQCFCSSSRSATKVCSLTCQPYSSRHCIVSTASRSSSSDRQSRTLPRPNRNWKRQVHPCFLYSDYLASVVVRIWVRRPFSFSAIRGDFGSSSACLLRASLPKITSWKWDRSICSPKK